MQRFPGLARQLADITKNPGSTVEELQRDVKNISGILHQVVEFLNNDLSGKLMKELEQKHKGRS